MIETKTTEVFLDSALNDLYRCGFTDAKDNGTNCSHPVTKTCGSAITVDKQCIG